MAEPLRNSYGPDVPRRIATMIAAVHPAFPAAEFLADALDGYETLELTPRARRITAALARHLPAEPAAAIDILIASLGPKTERLQGMEPFIYLPHVYFVADHGLDCFETSMRAQYELTQRFTAEFSIRAFLDRHPERTLERLRSWAADPSAHVRRLVSEGTRPRLPWAPRLRRFKEDPRPVLELLELLKDDAEEYVRRSVANNLNDIAKDHPDRVVEVCARWMKDASEHRRRLVRHALRTLIKRTHPGALALLGYDGGSPVTVAELRITPSRPEIGERVRIEIVLLNETRSAQAALVDIRVRFVKSKGGSGPKVFKGGEVVLDAGATATIRKTISLAQHSTRTHYPGRHDVEVLVNGASRTAGSFDVVAGPAARAPGNLRGG
jgi:3-methyladenine DNA glycosylase AlkC